MRRLALILLLNIIFLQNRIELTNLEQINGFGGGDIVKPTFNPTGEYLVVEQYGGGKRTENSIHSWFIDIKNNNQITQIKEPKTTSRPLHCFNLRWSLSSQRHAYIEAKLYGLPRFYKLNYVDILNEKEDYLDDLTQEISGNTNKSAMRSYTVIEDNERDVILFCINNKEMKTIEYSIFSNWQTQIKIPHLSKPYTQMEINSVDDGFLHIYQTDIKNNPEIVLIEDPIYEPENQVIISPYQNGLIVYEKKLNINTSQEIYLSFLGKKIEEANNNTWELYIIYDPFNNNKIDSVAESVHMFVGDTEQLLNYNHQWHPQYNIIFYIKRIQPGDKLRLFAYNVVEMEEIEVITNLEEGIQHIAISENGQKIALCGLVPGRLWVGDLVIK